MARAWQGSAVTKCPLLYRIALNPNHGFEGCANFAQSAKQFVRNRMVST